MSRVSETVHWKVLTHFVYVPDKELHPDYFDHWMSHADAVEKGDVFRDDCDGFAMTCSEMLLLAGEDPAKIKLVMCKTEINESHLVCSHDGWILDNRQRHVRRWESMPYQWISSMRMSEPGTWKEVA